MMAPPKTLAAAAVRPIRTLSRIGFIGARDNNSSLFLVLGSQAAGRMDAISPFNILPASAGSFSSCWPPIHYAGYATHLHPARCSPYPQDAECREPEHWLLNPLPAVDPNELFRRG